MVLAFFCWAICMCSSPVIIIKLEMRISYDEFREFGSIISVTTDAILARCMNSPQPPGENRVARSIALKK
jgi:hypothetical protein